MTEQIQPDSSVFIFPISTQLSEFEIVKILDSSKEFLVQWKSHGEDLSTRVWIEEKQFIIFVADSSLTLPSGCSKDKLFHFVENMISGLHLSLGRLDHFWIKSGGEILHLSKKELKEKLELVLINSDSQVFPTWINDFEDYNKHWSKPLKNFHSMLGITQKNEIFQK